MRGRRLIAVCAVTLGAAVGATNAGAASTITMSGSTSVEPLATKLAQAFVKVKKGTKFAILSGGSDVGINDVARGRVTIGMSSRDPKSADPGGIVFNKIARDAICVVTNPKNPLPTLSQDTIQNIFAGRLTNWSQVDGSRLNDSIRIVTRTRTSGTADAFQNIMMGEDLSVSKRADEVTSNGLQVQEIKADPNAIGYASFSFAAKLYAVPYQGVPCTLRNAKSGEYGGIRNFYFVTRGKAKGAAKAFIEFTRKNKKAQKIVASDWVPLR